MSRLLACFPIVIGLTAGAARATDRPYSVYDFRRDLAMGVAEAELTTRLDRADLRLTPNELYKLVDYIDEPAFFVEECKHAKLEKISEAEARCRSAAERLPGAVAFVAARVGLPVPEGPSVKATIAAVERPEPQERTFEDFAAWSLWWDEREKAVGVATKELNEAQKTEFESTADWEVRHRAATIRRLVESAKVRLATATVTAKVPVPAYLLPFDADKGCFSAAIAKDTAANDAVQRLADNKSRLLDVPKGEYRRSDSNKSAISVLVEDRELKVNSGPICVAGDEAQALRVASDAGNLRFELKLGSNIVIASSAETWGRNGWPSFYRVAQAQPKVFEAILVNGSSRTVVVGP